MTTPSDLLQSFAWEQFQRALGRKTERVNGVLAIEVPLPFGLKYWYAPRTGESRIMNQELWDRTCTALRKTGAIFLRVEHGAQPQIPNSRFQIPRVLRHSLEPEWTWRTSLDGTDEELLGRMHEKHRYNVRLAQKRGVSVRAMSNVQCPMANADSKVFWLLIHETAKRQGISTHPRRYYETMLETLAKRKTQNAKRRTEDTNCFLYIAERGDTPLAAAIVAHYGDTATYLHGGSSYAHRALMAPHLLHWRAMREARDVGMRWYDFGGISSLDSRFQIPDSRPDWSGLTRFKMGFGGEAVHHPLTRDLVFRPGWYRMLSWLANVRP